MPLSHRAFTPFARPSSDETRQIHAKIYRNCQTLSEIDMQIRHLLERQAQLNSENATLRCMLAPIRSLTYDVLSRIFHHHVLLQGDPWVLAHVSRTWRLTAFSTPSIWTGLHLELAPDTSNPPLNRRVLGKEYCHNVHQLEMALARASSNLLDIKLASPSSIPSVVRAHIPVMLHLVSQRMDRWKSLEVDGAISHLPGLNSSPLENLEKLVMKTKDTSLLRLINETATGLVDFTSTMLGLEEFTAATWWETLRHLDLRIPIDATLAAQTPLLKTVLSRAWELETLVLDFHQMQPESGPLAVLPNLRKLELYDIPHLLPFDCPNLTHLQVSLGKKPPIAPAPLPLPSKQIILPHLTHLIFQHPNLSTLSAITAPSLIELTISPQVRIVAPQFNDNALRNIWNAERRDGALGILKPKILRLEDMHVSAESLKNVLEFLDDLTAFTIKWVRTDQMALLGSLSASIPAQNTTGQPPYEKSATPSPSRRPLLCPSLHYLALYDTSTLRSNDTQAMQACFEEVVKVRRNLGVVEMRGMVCWPSGGESEMKEFRI